MQLIINNYPLIAERDVQAERRFTQICINSHYSIVVAGLNKAFTAFPENTLILSFHPHQPCCLSENNALKQQTLLQHARFPRGHLFHSLRKH